MEEPESEKIEVLVPVEKPGELIVCALVGSEDDMYEVRAIAKSRSKKGRKRGAKSIVVEDAFLYMVNGWAVPRQVYLDCMQTSAINGACSYQDEESPGEPS